MQEDLIVRRETRIPAPPAAVFALLTDADKILRWMGTEASVEPQSGGLYLVNVTGARFARGSFREVVPVHRLAYSFGWDGSDAVPPGSSLVEIDLADQPPDGTLLRLNSYRPAQRRAMRRPCGRMGPLPRPALSRELNFGRMKIGSANSRSGRGSSSPRPEGLLSEDAEGAAGCEMALDVEGVLDGGVNRQEALG